MTNIKNDTKTETKNLLYEKISRRLYPSLSTYEISFYAVTWCCGVFYALYNFYLACQTSTYQLGNELDLVPPWWSLEQSPRKKDASDHEWVTWKNSTYHVGLLVILQPVISQIIKRSDNCKKYLIAFNVFYPICVTLYLLGTLATLSIFLQIVFLFLVSLTRRAWLVWLSAIVYVIAQEYQPFTDLKSYIFPTYDSLLYEGYLTSVINAWINARCISFSLDRIWGEVPSDEGLIQSFLKLTAFCLYLPTGVMGPLITYKRFEESLHAQPRSVDKAWIVNAVFQSCRYLLWFAVTEASLFFFYQQLFSYYPNIVEKLDLWALCGMGYALGQFFQLKYVVMYGLSIHLARLDDIDAPPHPKCIGRISLYSDMWRHFDSGLYIFIQKYLYLPLLRCIGGSGVLARLLASIICFSFIYVWHGTHDFVLTWSILNFAGITCEALVKHLGRKQCFQDYENRLSPRGKRRLHALLASPLHIMSSLSNFYFFTGVTVANIFVRKVLVESWPKGFPILLFFMYTCAQTAIEIKNYEIKKELASVRDLKE